MGLVSFRFFFDLEDGNDGEMVADAAVIAGAEVGAVGLHVAMGGVGFGEEGEGEDAGLLVGKGGGVGENVVEDGPFALVGGGRCGR